MAGPLIVAPLFKTEASFSIQRGEKSGLAGIGTLRTASLSLLVAAAYCAGTWLGFAVKPPGHALSAFWPPNAILLGALLLAPVRRWWVFLLAVLPVHLLIQMSNGAPFSTAMGWYISNTAEALIGAACISRFARRRSLFDTVQGLLVFLCFGVVAAPLLTSFIDAAAVVLTGWSAGYWQLAATRLFSSMLAELTLVPVIVTFAQGGRDRLWQASWKRKLEGGALATGIVLASVLVFNAEIASPENIPALVYVPLPFLLWASLRFSFGGLSASLLGLALISTWSAVHGRGPFNSPNMIENVQSLQVMLCVATVPLMLLAAVIGDRRRTEESLRDMSARLIHTQEDERHRIARELHDDIGQRLTMVELGLENAADDCDSALKARLNELHAEVCDISKATHEISHGLYPSYLEHLGLATALRRLCHDIGREGSVEILFKAESLPQRLPPDISLCLYRVTQEALQNVVRHSTARTGMVSLKVTGGRLLLSIVDDGVGFAVDREATSGLGLTSMRERLRSVGGMLEIGSERIKGTKIDVSVPLPVQGQ